MYIHHHTLVCLCAVLLRCCWLGSGSVRS